MLEGTSSWGTTINKDLTSQLTSTDSKATVELAATYWELKLTAYADVKGTESAILMGRQSIDLTNSSSEIQFTLGAGNLDTAGTVKITGTYVYHAEVAKYTVGLYKLHTVSETPIAGYEDKDVEVTGTSGAFSFDKSGTYACPPGEYLFALKLLDSAGKELMMYSDLLIVSPGLCTEYELTIPDYMTKAPEKPTDFKAVLVESSANQTDTDAFYDVKFTWTDNSSNEKYFELVLTEYNADGTEKAHQTLPIAATGDSTTALAKYVSGSLLAGNEEYTLRLPTGRLFDATLKAKTSKDGGTVYASDAVSREASTSTTEVRGYPAPTAAKINLVRRAYNLNGGTLKLETDTTALASTSYYYQFSIYTGTDIPILSISATTNTLSKTVGTNTYPFKEWIDTATNAAAITPTGCVDGSYRATYNEGASISYTIAVYTDLENGKVTLSSTNAKAITGGYSVAIADEVTLAITDATYSKYRFELNNTKLYEGSDSSCRFTASQYGPGNYPVNAIGIKSDGIEFSCPFTLTIVGN